MKKWVDTTKDEMIISARLSDEVTTAVNYEECRKNTDALKRIVADIRNIIGHEPSGAELVVSGRFTETNLIWAVRYRYVPENEEHLAYLRETTRALRSILFRLVAA